MSELPPGIIEALLRGAGRGTHVGEAAVADLRREYATWRRMGGPLIANFRYTAAALPLALRLFIAFRGTDRGGRVGASLRQDVHYGVRLLARAPGFTVTAALTFALGIGATTAMFAAVHAILLRPLPYADANELVRIEVNTGGTGWYGSSMPEYFDFGDQLDALENVAAFTAGDVTMGDTLAPMRVRVTFASASLLPLLGVEPLRGRVFTADEETTENNRFVVLSHALWVEAYGGDPSIIGRTVPVGGFAYEVIGIMPPGFAFPDENVRAWVPFGMDRENPDLRNNHFLHVVGRLRAGETLERVAAQLDAYTQRAEADYPEIYSERGFRARVRTLHTSVVGEVRTPLVVLLVAVVLVLLIACVNVANLFFTRAEARQRELAVRVALGASSGRLVRQLTTEGVMLALVGGVLGLGFARLAVAAFVALAPEGTPRLDDVGIGVVPLLAALLLIAAAGLVLGAVPALHAARRAADGSLARGGRGVGARRADRRTRRVLVGAQVALACIVVIGAGLMLRTVRNLRAIDAGFDPSGVLTFAVTPLPGRYAEPEQRVAFWDALLERLRATPGVREAGAVTALPLSGEFSQLSIRVEGRVTTSIGDAPDGYLQWVTVGAHETLGVPLVRGRRFDARDRADALPVALITESFAKRFWPGRDPIGMKLKVFAESYPWLEVVGVVADLRHDALDGEPQPMWFVPHAQAQNAYGTPLGMYGMVRVDGDPAAFSAAVREAVRSVDATTPISRLRPLPDLVDSAIAGRTFTYDLLHAFGLVAVLLACIGVYGVASLSVAERRGEIGLRKALGADPQAILRLVALETVITVATGAAVGIAAALVGARVMESMLYQVDGTDPLTLAGALAILFATAFAACALPALRALRIHPLDSLRSDG